MTRAQNLAVFVTCLVAAMTYAGAVTIAGLGLFLLPGVVGAALLASFLAARHMSGTALILGGVLVLGWSELVNIWSGTAYGAAARSTFIAAGCTLVAVVVLRSDSPALFLIPVAASVCGALLLGAGGEVRLVAVVTAVCAALTLGWIEQSRRNWATPPRRGPALVLLSLLVGAIAAGVVLLQAQRDRRPPEALAAGRAYPHLKPPWTDPLGQAANSLSSPQPPPHATTPPPLRSIPPHTHRPSTGRPHHPATNAQAKRPTPVSHRKHAPPSRIWLYVLGGILLLALALAARLVAVRLAWRQQRRRLASGAPAEQITGAWAWMRIRLEACRLPLPAAISPDVAAAGGIGIELPAEVVVPLQALAASTATAAFANEQSIDPDDVSAAWTAAGRADASARGLLSRPRRARLAFRGPAPNVIVR